MPKFIFFYRLLKLKIVPHNQLSAAIIIQRKLYWIFFSDWNYGRQEKLDCCDSLLLSTTSPDSSALAEQDEKFGVYRLQYVDRSPKVIWMSIE